MEVAKKKKSVSFKCCLLSIWQNWYNCGNVTEEGEVARVTTRAFSERDQLCQPSDPLSGLICFSAAKGWPSEMTVASDKVFVFPTTVIWALASLYIRWKFLENL